MIDFCSMRRILKMRIVLIDIAVFPLQLLVKPFDVDSGVAYALPPCASLLAFSGELLAQSVAFLEDAHGPSGFVHLSRASPHLFLPLFVNRHPLEFLK